MKTDHTSEKLGTNPSRKEYFLRFKQQIPISVLFCQGTQETLIHFFWGCPVTRAWKDFLVSVDWLDASGVLADRNILVGHCVVWATFYIFSCKYKSWKPSIVEYIYQVKDNFIIEKISIIKGKEKIFEEKRTQIIQKRRLFEWTLLFFSCCFFNPIWTDSK